MAITQASLSQDELMEMIKAQMGAKGGQAPAKKQQGMGMPWEKFLQQPNADGTYTPSPKEAADSLRASSGLVPHQDGSGNVVDPTKNMTTTAPGASDLGTQDKLNRVASLYGSGRGLA